jgi:segregation and condensation protein B
MEDKIETSQIEAALEGIVEKYNSEFYPFEVRESGGGWQFLTKKDFHKTIAQLNGEKFLKRLSTAALETLAIIAYKQPITKGEIEAIRGVNSDYSVQKLLEKELIVISGRNEKLPGHPLVYSTSKTFMDYFGINSPEDLPKIKEVFAEQLVEPTLVRHQESETAEFLQGDSSEEFPEPHMEQNEDIPTEPTVEDAEAPVVDASQLTINEEGMLVENKDDENEEPENDPDINNEENEQK